MQQIFLFSWNLLLRRCASFLKESFFHPDERPRPSLLNKRHNQTTMQVKRYESPTNPCGGQAMGGVTQCTGMRETASQRVVPLSFGVPAGVGFATGVIGMRMILMNCHQTFGGVHDGYSKRASSENQPVVPMTAMTCSKWWNCTPKPALENKEVDS